MGSLVALIQFISTPALGTQRGPVDATYLGFALVFLATTREPHCKTTPALINLGVLNEHQALPCEDVDPLTLYSPSSSSSPPDAGDLEFALNLFGVVISIVGASRFHKIKPKAVNMTSKPK